jgi:hypothetical protein
MDTDTPSTTLYTPEEQLALDKAKSSLKYTGSRYEIGIPWKEDHPILPNNRSMAERRFFSLEKSLNKKPKVAERYNEVMQSNIDKGYIVETTFPTSEQACWYLPHFPVIREDKLTTKVRIVLDSAAQYEDTSLNDMMLTGPKIQKDLIDIILRFRSGAVALTGDIKEMFPQVQLRAEDQNYHRLLWRDIGSSGPLKEYKAVRLTFGDRASPFLAQYVVASHAEKNQDRFPLAVAACANALYMDDSIVSVDNVHEGVNLRKELSSMLKEAGFEIRRWCSNKLSVLADVPKEDQADGINFETEELPCVKTLGVKWDAQSDTIGYQYTASSMEVVTKRTLLSKVAKLFDPLQLLAPFVIRAKIILQEAWILGLGWDEPFPSSLATKVTSWIEELPDVANFQLPRWYYGEGLLNRQLHVFVDASSLAYAAVAYILSKYNDGHVSVSLVLARARVAPIKAVSIPRLELMAAVLGMRLGFRVATQLELNVEEAIFWSDSMDVICWLHGKSRRYKPFVAHRVSAIQEVTNPSQWRHVPGIDNPADLATRGAKVEDMSMDTVWTTGPRFLHRGREDWPTPVEVKPEAASQEVLAESKKIDVSSSYGTITSHLLPSTLFDPERYSTWSKTVRVTAWCRRWRRMSGLNRTISPTLEADEILTAEKYWLQYMQGQEQTAGVIEQLKSGEVVKNMRNLSPFLDAEGLLRVGGRLEKSQLPYDAKYPIIVPSRNHLCTLLVRHYHTRCKHAKGTNALLAETRQRFWILNGRAEIKRFQQSCILCIKIKKKQGEQLMASLPSFRVTVPIRAFAKCGIDFAGPFTVKITRFKRDKRYICLFTCLCSRAVHLEVAHGLDTQSFLNAFSRMSSRRGRPEEVVTDNGSNFVGAERYLRELVEGLNQTVILEKAAELGISWKFNPPLGSHHGGVFEAMVKAVKKALKAILSEVNISDEELLTAVVEVEGLLNSRPLVYCGNDPLDEVLTPNHFLYGQSGGQLAPAVMEGLAFNLRHRWRLIQDLVTKVWRRWMREYLSIQQQRPKWFRQRENLKVDEIVLFVDQSNPKGRWPLAKVVKVYPGSDGHVRVVDLEVAGKTMRRPITKLCPLPVVRD